MAPDQSRFECTQRQRLLPILQQQPQAARDPAARQRAQILAVEQHAAAVRGD